MPKVEQHLHILDNEERTGIQNEITLELLSAQKKFPLFPIEADRCVSIVTEECGEATKAAIDFVILEVDQNSDKVRGELIQTGAMVLRAIAMIDRMKAATGR